MDKVPTTIVSGFLGSGKTTIISGLIDELQKRNEQVVYIKNEIGDENVDAKLMEGKHIATKQLLNGCICCTLTGPFISAIEEVLASLRPDRIIIEASGVADPSALALMVSAQPGLHRDGVLTIIDVVHFEGYKDLSFAAREQAKFTDLIIFNKVELADTARKVAVVGYVRELNDFAPIVEAPQGKIAASVVFGISKTELDSLLIEKQQQEEQGELRHHHLEEDMIQTVKFETDLILDQEKLSDILENFPLNVFRVKGYIRTATNSLLVNRVGKRLDYLPYSELLHSSVLICIGFNISENKEELYNKLAGSVHT